MRIYGMYKYIPQSHGSVKCCYAWSIEHSQFFNTCIMWNVCVSVYMVHMESNIMDYTDTHFNIIIGMCARESLKSISTWSCPNYMLSPLLRYAIRQYRSTIWEQSMVKVVVYLFAYNTFFCSLDNFCCCFTFPFGIRLILKTGTIHVDNTIHPHYLMIIIIALFFVYSFFTLFVRFFFCWVFKAIWFIATLYRIYTYFTRI